MQPRRSPPVGKRNKSTLLARSAREQVCSLEPDFMFLTRGAILLYCTVLLWLRSPVHPNSSGLQLVPLEWWSTRPLGVVRQRYVTSIFPQLAADG